MTAALEGGEWSAACPGRTLPPGKTWYPFYRRLGRPQGQSGQAENLVHTRIMSWTVQPVAQSLYRLSYPAHSLNYYWYVNIILEDGTVMPELYEIAAEEYCCVRLTHLVPLIQIVLSSLVYDVTLYLNQF